MVQTPTSPYKLICSDCRRTTTLKPSEYAKQLEDTKHDGFVCPNCGSEEVTFDEQHYESVMGVKRVSFPNA